MKKALLIGVTLAVMLALMFWADSKMRMGARPTAKAATAAAPDVVLKDLQGNEVNLAQYKGKVVLVNFWATWCGPCRIEIPWLIEFQQQYGPRGFTVLGVAMDDEGKTAVEPFVTKERFDVNGQPTAMNYPILLGSDEIADKFGGLIGLPTSMLISRDGKKVKTILGLVNHDELVKAIEGQL
jgi:thiol-disulfide isomerase/thioredoxin